MDALDLKLINELEIRGYQKPVTLAPTLGLTERTVRRRMSNLINGGMIKVVAVLNPMSSKYSGGGGAIIGIRVEPKFLYQVASDLVSRRTTISVSYSLGSFDIMTTVYFDTMDRLSYFVNLELTKIKGIVSTETIILTWLRKYFRFYWPLPRFGETNGRLIQLVDYRGVYNYQSDEIDRKIIRYLMEDALTPHKIITSKVGIAESTLRKRIQRMLNSETIKIEAVPNPIIFENEVWATIGITTRKKSPNNIINALIDNPTVYMATVSIGRFNMILLVRFRHIDLLRRFVEIELPNTDGVSSTEAFLHSRIIKQHGINWL